MVLTELLQNAVQHGFPDSHAATGNVVVSLANDGTELAVLVRDDGVGLPRHFAVDGSTLGLTIVRTLVTTELGGTITMSTDGGTLVDLRIPVSAGAVPTN